MKIWLRTAWFLFIFATVVLTNDAITVLYADYQQEKCFLIKDSGKIKEIEKISDSVFACLDPFVARTIYFYFISKNIAIRKLRVTKECNNEKTMPVLKKIAENGEEIGLYKINCSYEIYKKIISNNTQYLKDYLILETKTNYTKAIFEIDDPDTLFLGQVKRNVDEKCLRQLISFEGQFVPHKKRNIMFYLSHRYPQCIDIDYIRRRSKTNKGNKIVEKAEIEMQFPIGFPCDYLKRDASRLNSAGFKCIMPDTLILHYINKKDNINEIRNALKKIGGLFKIEKII